VTRTTRLPLGTSLVLAILATLAGTVGLSDPAGATSASYTNPSSCTATVNNGVCISSITADYTPTTITLTTVVGQATDPTSDPNWNDSGSTSIGWGIYLNGSSTLSYVAAETAVETGGSSTPVFQGGINTFGTMTFTCLGSSQGVTSSFDVSANSYSISFPPSCVGSPTSIALYSAWNYDDDGTTTSVQVPTGGTSTCCTVTASDDTTTTSSTTTTTSTTTTSTTSTASTTTTIPSSAAGATTTTTSPVAAVVSSAASTGNTGSGSSGLASTGNTGSGSSGLASTGLGDDSPVILAAGIGMIVVGVLGRRRLVRLALRARRSHPQ
jgi:hypothetical protein